MDKKLRFLGLTAAMGILAISSVTAIAQRASIGGGGGSGTDVQIASRDGGGNAPGAHHARKRTVVQEVLQLCLNGRANVLIDQAEAQNLNKVVTKIILANDQWMLTTMLPDQQQHEIHDVWQVEKWVPGDKVWAEVCKAPSLIKELLNVDEATSNKIQTAQNAIWDEIMSPLVTVEKRLMAEPGFEKLTKQEQQQRVFDEMHKLPKKSAEQRAAESLDRFNRLLEQARSLLSGKQRVEFDAFVARHEQAMATATSGMLPPIVNH